MTVLPFQSICLTVFAGPLYGFNALIQRINEVFSPSDINTGWAGAIAGGDYFLVGRSGWYDSPILSLWVGSRARLFVIMNVAIIAGFGVGALACHLKLYWLLLLGFAIPTGLCFVNLFFIGIVFLVNWGHEAGRVGLSTGIAGMLFGIWGAVYSVIGPYIVANAHLIWFLLLSGIAVSLIELLALTCMLDPVGSGTSAEPNQTKAETPTLTFKDIAQVPSFWVFFFFFILFLTPGFGFKLIVAALSDRIFHATQWVASIIAASFLICYGTSRLGLWNFSVRVRYSFG